MLLQLVNQHDNHIHNLVRRSVCTNKQVYFNYLLAHSNRTKQLYDLVVVFRGPPSLLWHAPSP